MKPWLGSGPGGLLETWLTLTLSRFTTRHPLKAQKFQVSVKGEGLARPHSTSPTPLSGSWGSGKRPWKIKGT